MSLLSMFTDRIIGSIPENQKNGMEEAMAGIAGGAAAVAMSVEAVKAITPEIAQLAQSIGTKIPTMQAAEFLTTPGDSMAKGDMSLAKG